MFAITMTNGTICTAERVLAVMYPHDDEGKRTYYVAQIQGAKRRIKPEDVAAVAELVR